MLAYVEYVFYKSWHTLKTPIPPKDIRRQMFVASVYFVFLYIRFPADQRIPRHLNISGAITL